MNFEKKSIGARIAHLREAKGLTTNRLANNCGLSQSFLRSVELGEKRNHRRKPRFGLRSAGHHPERLF